MNQIIKYLIMICFFTLSCSKDPDTYYPKDGLVSYLSFDSGLTDSEGGLTLVSGSGTFVAGKKGQALNPLGNSTILYSTGIGNPNITNFTISCWFKNLNYLVIVAAFFGNTEIYQDNLGDIKDHLYFNLFNSDNTLIQNKSLQEKGVWHHVAGTFDGKEAKLYINGILASVKSTTGDIKKSTNNMCSISSQQDGNLIDELFIYNRVLNSEEVMKLYNLQ